MFGKLNRTADQNHEGLGLGLMVCKLIVEANGGQITVKSNGAEQGCEFKFSIKATTDLPNI